MLAFTKRVPMIKELCHHLSVRSYPIYADITPEVLLLHTVRTEYITTTLNKHIDFH